MLALASVFVAVQIRSSPGLTEGTATVRPAAPESKITDDLVKDPQFQLWLHNQAQRIDNPRSNPAAVQAEMNAKVNALTQIQTRQLLQIARSHRAPAAEKILSTYMLVEAGPRALQELRELITTPMSSGQHGPEELDNVREKTLKIMAIDGLASHAQNDPRAREALERSIAEAQDPSVKKYAQEQYDRLHQQ
jgi:hypothetical protein